MTLSERGLEYSGEWEDLVTRLQLYQGVGNDQVLTLHLEDGRRWDCVILDMGGRVVSAGKDLYRRD